MRRRQRDDAAPLYPDAGIDRPGLALRLFLLLAGLSIWQWAGAQGYVPPLLIELRDEGTSQGFVNKVNCTGGGLTCSIVSGVGTIDGSAGGGGDSISVNATAATDANFNDTDPAAPSDTVNIKLQIDTTDTPDNVSAYVQAASATLVGVMNTIAQSFAGAKTWLDDALFDDSMNIISDASPAQITSDQNDYSGCDVSANAVCRLTTDAHRRVTGLANGADGRTAVIMNVGSSFLTLMNEDSASTAANRFRFTGAIEKSQNRLLYPHAAITLLYDSTDSRWREIGGSRELQDQAHIEEWRLPTCQFPTGAGSEFMYCTATGTGSQCIGASGSANATCVTSLESGTQATSGATVRQGISTILFGGGVHLWQAGLLTPSALSDGTNRYTLRSGFNDNTVGAATDGCYLQYVDDVNTGKWQGICRSNSVESACDTGVTVVVSTYYETEVLVNAGGTRADFSVTGGSCSVTTNIPTGTGRETSLHASILKSLGTTERVAAVDYIHYRFERGIPF